VERVVERFPDGRLNIVTRGRRRFLVHAVDERRSFLRGAAEFFQDDEEEEPSAELCDEATKLVGAREGDGPQLSFDLAKGVRDLHARQQLLMSRSESERLRLLTQIFPMQNLREAYAQRMKVLAVRNGHGKKGPGPLIH
jgi:Lon protease-like protein